MKIEGTELEGVRLITLEPHGDERGHLARTYCEREFADAGLNTNWPQHNATLTRDKGMLRGIHYQAQPSPEIKLIRCTSGAIWDVVVDVRKDSPTFGKWKAFELTSENHRQLYVPAGFAHGFQCLEDNCGVFYLMSDFYVPELARGVRWDDPQLNISWPIAAPVLSERDQNLPLLSGQ